MYRILIRPVLFLLPPEFVHKLLVAAVTFFFRIPFLKNLIRSVFQYKSKRLETTISGLTFKGKVGLAAGFDKNADFFDDFSVFGFSFIEIGTVTPKAQPGNEKPRLFRLTQDDALVNRMGFNNKGVDHAALKLKKRAKGRIIVGGNIGKNTATPNGLAADDYLYSFQQLYEVADYFVVNVSCPNVGSLHELQDTRSLRIILDKIMQDRHNRPLIKPVWVKISPDLTFQQIDEILDLCTALGVDGIVATNTTTRRDKLKTPEETIDRTGNGGLSGAPLTDRSTEIIRYIHTHTKGKMPVIGAGGIMTPEDALEKIRAGACLLQIYTGFIYHGPCLAKRINKTIDRYLALRSQ